jgi:hypothetical protein
MIVADRDVGSVKILRVSSQHRRPALAKLLRKIAKGEGQRGQTIADEMLHLGTVVVFASVLFSAISSC